MKFSTGNFQSRGSYIFDSKTFQTKEKFHLRKVIRSTLPLAFPFFAFSLGGEKREKPYGSGNPCRIAVLRQARQAERQQAPTLLSPSGRVARSAERGQIKILPYIEASPCPSCLRTMRQKWSAYFIGFPSGGRLCRGSGGGEGRRPFLIF